MTTQSWKWPHIAKGMLTWIPLVNSWRQRAAFTGGTNNPRYCYSVWLRHLITLLPYGFRIKGASVGELGPGDSIGVGLGALLSGGAHYIGLDRLPFSATTNLEAIFDELTQLYIKNESIPDNSEFPRIRPQLQSYEFPNYAIEWTGFSERVERIRNDIRKGLDHGQMIRYQAPWTSTGEMPPNSLDLFFSQAVLEYVVPLEKVYTAMSTWLKPGGYCSHIINFSATYLAPFWDGHWAYSDWEWRLVRGRREFFLNREPLSTHLACAKDAGFEILLVKRDYGGVGLELKDLAKRFQTLNDDDLQTRGAMLILRKPV